MKNILVINDEEFYLDAATLGGASVLQVVGGSGISSEGFFGPIANTLNDAVSRVLELSPDIILLDHNLGHDLNGEQIASALRLKGYKGIILGTSSDPQSQTRYVLEHIRKGMHPWTENEFHSLFKKYCKVS